MLKTKSEHFFRDITSLDLLESATFQHIVTLNPEIFFYSQQNHNLQRIIEQATVTIDSQFLFWAGRLKGFRKFRKLSGSQLIFDTAIYASSRGRKIVLIGDTIENNALAVTELNTRFEVEAIGFSPEFSVAGECDSSIMEEIVEFKPDYIFVGLGCPKQELWIAQNSLRLSEANARFAVGCGGAIGMLAGAEKRAPPWVGNIGLEWAWRLARNPQRFSRLWKVVTGIALFSLLPARSR